MTTTPAEWREAFLGGEGRMPVLLDLPPGYVAWDDRGNLFTQEEFYAQAEATTTWVKTADERD